MSANNLQPENRKPAAGFAGRTALLLTGNGARLLVQLIVLFVYSRALAVEDYGRYQYAWMFLNFFSIITLFGLPTLLLSSPMGSVQQLFRRRGKLFAFLFAFLYTLPVVFLLWKGSPLLWDEKCLLMLWLVAHNFSQLAEVRAIRTNQLKRLLAVNIFVLTSWLAAHLLILRFGYSLPLLITTLAIIGLLKTILLWRPVPGVAEEPNPETGKQMLYLAMVDILGAGFRWADKWVIFSIASLSAFALYSNGAYEIPLFGLMVSATGAIMTVDMSRTGDRNLIHLMYKASFRMLGTLVLPAFAFLICFHQEIFLLLFSEKYEAAIPVFFICLFVIPVRITHYTAGMQAMGRGDIILKGAFYDLALAIALMWVLYPLLGVKGLALSMVISTWLQAIYYLWHTAKLTERRIFSFIPYRYLILLLIICVGVMFGAKTVIDQTEVTNPLIWGIGTYLLLAFAMVITQWKTIRKNKK